jgi:glyoxylate reductase
MVKPKIFVTQPIAESALQRLSTVMDVEIHPDTTRPISKNDLLKGVGRNDYLFIRLSDTVDAEAMDANPN